MINDMGIDRTGVVAYCPLYYGADYLDAAIRSVDPCVDLIYIIYTPTPSHGFSTDKPCPDTQEELMKIATNASDKVRWITVSEGFRFEGEHRNFIYRFTDGFKQVLAFDSDEVFHTEELKLALQEAENLPNRYVNVDGFVNFWKSFNHVNRDHFHPTRITNLNVIDNGSKGVVRCTVYHFGCALREEIMRFKFTVYGHRDEIFSDWLEGKYFGWTPETRKLHMASRDIWDRAEDFDKTTLPDILKNHPYYNLEKIS